MGGRVRLTGLGDSGPVWVWANHVAAVHAETFAGQEGHAGKRVKFVPMVLTVVTTVGGQRHLVTEPVERVLDLLDAAAAGVPRDE